MKIKIINYPNYLIEDTGAIYLIRSRRKVTVLDKKGYEHVTLSNKGTKTTFLIHRLVAIHFIPNPNNLPQINHKDGNKRNNCKENLEWVTGSTNIKHAFENGLSSYKGEKNGKAKLTEYAVKQIKLKIAKKIKLKDIANEYNVHPNTISEIKRGIKWKHINL